MKIYRNFCISCFCILLNLDMKSPILPFGLHISQITLSFYVLELFSSCCSTCSLVAKPPDTSGVSIENRLPIPHVIPKPSIPNLKPSGEIWSPVVPSSPTLPQNEPTFPFNLTKLGSMIAATAFSSPYFIPKLPPILGPVVLKEASHFSLILASVVNKVALAVIPVL